MGINDGEPEYDKPLDNRKHTSRIDLLARWVVDAADAKPLTNVSDVCRAQELYSRNIPAYLDGVDAAAEVYLKSGKPEDVTNILPLLRSILDAVSAFCLLSPSHFHLHLHLDLHFHLSSPLGTSTFSLP